MLRFLQVAAEVRETTKKIHNEGTELTKANEEMAGPTPAKPAFKAHWN